jgi:hypothetical protein
MLHVKHLRWFLLGLFLGLLVFGAGFLVRQTHDHSVLASPAHAGDADVPGIARPRLRIECGNDDECLQSSEDDWKDGRGPLRRRFLRLRIYNDGPGIAEACRVTLRDVTEVLARSLRSTRYKGPSPLIWPGDPAPNRAGKSVAAKGKPEVVDLLYTVKAPGGDEIYVKDAQYSKFLKFGRLYKFEVAASTRGEEVVEKDILVRFGPTWDDIEVVPN